MIVWLWIGFIAFVLGMLAIDLGVFNRQAHVISLKEALRWTAVCVVLALAFDGFVYFLYERHWFGIGREIGHATGGARAATDFLSGYVVEMSLSMDNIFVIALIFNYFAVPRIYQHRTLFWGIMGALIMRGTMILAGTALIEHFEWIIYVFGVLLLLTAVKMLFSGHERIEPDRNPLVRLVRRMCPVTGHFEGERFFVRVSGRRAVTPLFLTLIVIETTDVVFAVDSIPAVFGLTRDPFIVFTSNVFAILCLRSMYFALADLIARFRYLKISLVSLLFLVGVKMLLSHYVKVPADVSLLIILGILSLGVITSALRPLRPEDAPESPSNG